MSYFCENCHVLSERGNCLICGKKKLRQPIETDYCFLVELSSMFGSMLVGIFDEEHIVYAVMPSGTGVRARFALEAENSKIFVVYKNFDKAKEILDQIFADAENKQRKSLQDNIGKLFVTLPRNERKMKKKLELNEDKSLVDYCSDIIMNADRVVNKGGMVGGGGDFLFVYKGNELVIVNSLTFEILSVERKESK